MINKLNSQYENKSFLHNTTENKMYIQTFKVVLVLIIEISSFFKLNHIIILVYFAKARFFFF